jgi:hypothetical protein
LERLNDEDLKKEDLEEELKRAEAVAKIAQNIINNGELMFKAQKHYDEYGISYKKENLFLEEVKDER